MTENPIIFTAIVSMDQSKNLIVGEKAIIQMKTNAPVYRDGELVGRIISAKSIGNGKLEVKAEITEKLKFKRFVGIGK